MIQKKSLPPEIVNSISQFGENIRIARKRRSITMDEMAARMYVSRKTLSRLEMVNLEFQLAFLLWFSGAWA